MLYNLLSLPKRETQRIEFHTAKPKRLQFVLLNAVGWLVRHAGEIFLRVVSVPVRTLHDIARVDIHVKHQPLFGV